ncbi:hypothetical protein [Undibacterium sp. SXout20W]|uniref:hypothetical protein n=1 Tax=Undibacterium sp. SXout20W TaxID=3413051 RepID=UPI003BF035D1
MIFPALRPSTTSFLPIAEESTNYDQLTAGYIEMGLSLQQSYGTSCAIEYLQGKGVPNRITERVLVRSNQHR